MSAPVVLLFVIACSIAVTELWYSIESFVRSLQLWDDLDRF